MYGEFTLELQNLAAYRRVSDIEIQDKIRPSFKGTELLKNPGGVLLLSMMQPTYNRIVDVYWKTEDLRSALRQRLLSP
jgi:hypothetical protein